jgi:hypothetical protein
MPTKSALLLVLTTLAAARPARGDDPPRQEGAPKGLIGIAETEAKRTARALREKILGGLRTYGLLRDQAPDRAREQLESIVQYGAEAVPLLLDVLHGVAGGTTDAGFAGPSARALAAIHVRTGNPAILKSMAELVRSGNGAVRAGVLEGLETIDQPMVVEIVGPLLQEQDPALRNQVVRVLGRQRSSAELVSGLLIPLLKQEGVPPLEVLGALHRLGDRGGLETAQALLNKSTDPDLLNVSIRYLDSLGTKGSLPALRVLLNTHGAAHLSDPLLKKAVDAVQQIGLRDSDARKPAEEILVDVFKKHTAFAVRDHARWQLGPYQNDDALKDLEAPVQTAIKDRRFNNSSVADLWIEIAEYRLHFEQWADAMSALNKATAEDEKGLRKQRIEPLKAVSYCGQGKYPAADKILRAMTADERYELLEKYPILEKMGKDPKYRDLFPAPK